MATIVKGHGELPSDDQDTFVPLGTTVKFYSDFDVNLGTTVALVAIANGAKETPKETISGTGTIGDVANYKLYEQDDGFIAKWLAMGGESGIPIEWVGGAGRIPDGTRLCEKPGECTGTHTCNGVLGLVKDTEIIILACRGFESDDDQKSEFTYCADSDSVLHGIDADVDEFVDKILALAKTNPDEAERQVDDLPQGSIALMVNRIDYDTWQKARYVKDLAQRNDFEQIIGHLTANSSRLDDIMDWLDDVPSYGTALDQAALGHGQAWVMALNKAPDEVKTALRRRDYLDAVEDGGDWQPDDTALDEITKTNQANVKGSGDGEMLDIRAGGLLVLVGDGHEDNHMVYVLRQGDLEQGAVTVTKGGVFSKGKLDVKGIGAKQALVRTALEAISDKTITFA